MSETTWVIIVLVLVAALVAGAYMLGRASALAETRRSAAPEPEAPERGTRPIEQSSSPGLSRSAAPPPASAGGDRAPPSAGSTATPHRRAAPPPASAAGPSAGSPQASAPQRTAKPPPAQAAWSTPKPDGKN